MNVRRIRVKGSGAFFFQLGHIINVLQKSILIFPCKSAWYGSCKKIKIMICP